VDIASSEAKSANKNNANTIILAKMNIRVHTYILLSVRPKANLIFLKLLRNNEN
jgi:hypothetical protein